MKVAIASDDQKTIANHFGRTRGFMIYEIEDGEIKSNYYRENDFTGHARGQFGHQNGHMNKHAPVLHALADCSVVCARGMGRRVYDDLASANIQVFVVQEHMLDDAIRNYLNASLQDHPDKSCDGDHDHDHHHHNHDHHHNNHGQGHGHHH